MNDVMLYAKLKQLGVPNTKAWDLTRRIRDVYHPVAAVAASRIRSSRGLGAGPIGAPTGNQAQRSVSLTMTGASVGATVGSIVPIVGTAIGAAVGAIVGAIGSLFGPAKEGQAAITWDNLVQSGNLQKHMGREFDQRYYAEAMKGAMDKGSNVWPGCGAVGHKNPDCFYGPLASVIASGYLNRVVPLSASTADVMRAVVNPWLQSGANGLFRWGPYAAENSANGNMQGLLVQGAVDRYLSGLPITRADMPEYLGQGYAQHQPLINTALAPLLQTTATPSTSPSVALAQAPSAQVPATISQAANQLVAGTPGVPALGIPNAQISSVATPSGLSPATVAQLTPQQDTTAALLAQILANQNANMVSPQAQQLLANVAANGVQQTPYGPPVGGIDLSQWILPGAVVGGGVLLYMMLGKKK